MEGAGLKSNFPSKTPHFLAKNLKKQQKEVQFFINFLKSILPVNEV
jgi:hypothetical protein